MSNGKEYDKEKKRKGKDEIKKNGKKITCFKKVRVRTYTYVYEREKDRKSKRVRQRRKERKREMFDRPNISELENPLKRSEDRRLEGRTPWGLLRDPGYLYSSGPLAGR